MPMPRVRNLLTPVLVALAVFVLAPLAGCKLQPQDATSIPHTPIPKAPARFSMELTEGKIRYSGIVADRTTQSAIISSLDASSPGASGKLTVEPRIREPAWLSQLGAAATALQASGGRLIFSERQIVLEGSELSQENRATLLRQMRKLYPGYKLTGAFDGVDMRHALPIPGDLPGLVEFLKSAPLAFYPGTGMLTPASLENLSRAARGMRASGATARVQVLIYPDSEDTPSKQEREIAQQRVDAITTQMALRGVPPDRVQVVSAPAEPGKQSVVEFAAYRDDAQAAPASADLSTDAADADAADSDTTDARTETPADDEGPSRTPARNTPSESTQQPPADAGNIIPAIKSTSGG